MDYHFCKFHTHLEYRTIGAQIFKYVPLSFTFWNKSAMFVFGLTYQWEIDWNTIMRDKYQMLLTSSQLAYCYAILTLIFLDEINLHEPLYNNHWTETYELR